MITVYKRGREREDININCEINLNLPINILHFQSTGRNIMKVLSQNLDDRIYINYLSAIRCDQVRNCDKWHDMNYPSRPFK